MEVAVHASENTHGDSKPPLKSDYESGFKVSIEIFSEPSVPSYQLPPVPTNHSLSSA